MAAARKRPIASINSRFHHGAIVGGLPDDNDGDNDSDGNNDADDEVAYDL